MCCVRTSACMTLHTFPTRRSSDLNAVSRWPPFGVRYAPSSRTAMRSEEHTSELQSRENLVCRLLLDKNKDAPRTNDLLHDVPQTATRPSPIVRSSKPIPLNVPHRP